jgi:hypothetical protein
VGELGRTGYRHDPGFCASSHASATCAGVKPLGLPTSVKASIITQLALMAPGW